MKDRRPRKVKKIAKKRKAAADATTMVKAALITAQGAVQLAIISSAPTPSFVPPSVRAAEKALRITQHCVDSAKAVQTIMSKIKDWRAYA